MRFDTGRCGVGGAVVVAVGLSMGSFAAWAAEPGAAFGFVPYPGVFTSFAGVSADGTVGGGRSGGFRDYDALVFENLVPSGMSVSSGTPTQLPRVPAGSSSDALSISGDGNVVIGRSGLAAGSDIRATIWTRGAGGNWTGAVLNDANGNPTGDLIGGSVSGQPRDGSYDGSVIVGVSTSANGGEAFRWTAATGMVGMGDLPGGGFQSDAHGVSDDGTVIVGGGVYGFFDPQTNTNYTGAEAFRWTAATGMVGLGHVPGGIRASGARGISGDGLVVVGEAGFPAAAGIPGGRVPASWSATTGWVDLGPLPNDEAQSLTSRNGIALDASYDGAVIVGTAAIAGPSSVFVWTQASGMRSLKEVMVDAGVTDIDGWDLLSVEGISADGRTIVGGAESPIGSFEAYVLTLPYAFVNLSLPGDTDGDGDIDDTDLGTAFANYTGPLTPGTGGKLPSDADTDGDGDVDDSDLGTMFAGYTGPLSPTNVPEPASLFVLLMGKLICSRRRRSA